MTQARGPWFYLRDGDPDVQVVVEDDGRVCYAYLVWSGGIVADVWLYNRVEGPAEPEWKLPDARSRMPFLNAAGHCAAETAVIDDRDLVEVRWRDAPSGEPIAGIFVGAQLWAVLTPGALPGWSRFAERSGPVAMRLAECPCWREEDGP
jgi:hypothetical protein